jgi:predicted transcriptional regulator
MTRPTIAEDEEASVIKIATDMKELDIGSVVITKEGKPVGIVTERDIALKVLLYDRRASEVKAKEIMSSPLITIEPEASVEDACELATKNSIKRLPVVENDVPVGIISVRNILTRKPEYISRFYPKIHVLASGWTLDRLERSFSECEGFLANKDVNGYKKRLNEVYEELSELARYYVDDKELRGIFENLRQLYQDIEREGEVEKEFSLESQRKRLDDILRDLRYITYIRKQQSISSLASGSYWFRDYRHGGKKDLRLPYKRTRP